MLDPTDVLIVGAGPAGLATSAALTRVGVSHRVLERGDRAGATWAHLYDSLVLHTTRRLSRLPGLDYPPGAPRFPTRDDFLTYLDRYAATFRVPAEFGADVTRARRQDREWTVSTTAGLEYRARTLVVATGIVANPQTPAIDGRASFRGRVLHSVEYTRPGDLPHGRVLVVGAGNSAADIAVDFAKAGADVTIAVRSGATVVPRTVAGVPVQYLGLALGTLPRPVEQVIGQTLARIIAIGRGAPPLPPAAPTACPRVPLIGLDLPDQVRAGRIRVTGGLETFTATGMRFDDGTEQAFETVIFATGYRAALGFLGPLAHVDECGFARRRDRVASADQPALYFVGHNYGIQGGIFNIARDARRVARAVAGRVRSAAK